MNKPRAENSAGFGALNVVRLVVFCLFAGMFAVGCRYDMQDQPRYKAYKESDFFSDGKSMQDPPEGTVARGQLQ